jgi:hypothetical protein
MKLQRIDWCAPGRPALHQPVMKGQRRAFVCQVNYTSRSKTPKKTEICDAMNFLQNWHSTIYECLRTPGKNGAGKP